MSRASILILIGILIILVPYSGIPSANRSLLEVIFGVCVFGFGISLRAREVRMAQSNIESSPPPATEMPFEDTQETSFQ